MKRFLPLVTLLGILLLPAALPANQCDLAASDASCWGAQIQSVCASGNRMGVCAPEARNGDQIECRCVLESRRNASRDPVDTLLKVHRGVHQIVRDVILDEPNFHIIVEAPRRPVCRNSNFWGKYADGGGCNTFGCWPPGGSCNPFGCSTTDQCHPGNCRDKIETFHCE